MIVRAAQSFTKTSLDLSGGVGVDSSGFGVDYMCPAERIAGLRKRAMLTLMLGFSSMTELPRAVRSLSFSSLPCIHNSSSGNSLQQLSDHG